MSILRFARYCLFGTTLMLPSVALAVPFIVVEHSPRLSSNQKRHGQPYNHYDRFEQNPYDMTPREREEQARRSYQQTEDELLREHAPPPPAPLTRKDIEEILDKKLDRKAQKVEPPLPEPEPENSAFGKVGGLGPVGGITQSPNGQ